MNKAVVDASVAAKWVVEEEHSANAARLLDYDELHAPDHWLAEATNVVWSKVFKGDLAAKDAEERVTVLLRAPVIGTALAGLMPIAFAIAVEHAVTIYDALYLALASQRGLPFVTADEALVRRLSGTKLSPLVVRVGDLG